MKRVAYLSPLNPTPSGISDYSEELLPYLAQYAEITLYVDERARPSDPRLAQHFDIRSAARLERDQRRRPFDALLYHMGNSPVHAWIWRAMQRTPGVLVLHDFVLHHFMLNYAATVLRSIESYQAEAAQRYGSEGERIARLMLHGRFTEAAFELPFCERVLERATGLIAHSRYVLERAHALRPDLPAALAPMGVPLPARIPRAVARVRLGLPADAPILASFGHINPYKRIDAVLRALQLLRAERPGLRYLLVGSISPNYDVRAAVVRAGLEDVVTITGYVDRTAFEDYVAAADICLNLRHPTAGETSASLLRILGAGRATLVTASGSFMELPPGVAAQTDPDASEGDLILAYCRLLLDHPELRAALGANAREYVARDHTLEGAAEAYMRFLAAQGGWGEPRKLRDRPLWEPGEGDEGGAGADEGRTTKDESGLEQPQARFDQLKPGMKLIESQLDKDQARVELIDSRVDKDQACVELVDSRVDKDQARVELIDSRVELVDSRVDKDQARVELIDSRVDKDQERLELVEERLEGDEGRRTKDESGLEQPQARFDQRQPGLAGEEGPGPENQGRSALGEPTAVPGEGSAIGDLQAATAAALAELGATEDDSSLLGGAARALADLA